MAPRVYTLSLKAREQRSAAATSPRTAREWVKITVSRAVCEAIDMQRDNLSRNTFLAHRLGVADKPD
jgi:hypothetical protein